MAQTETISGDTNGAGPLPRSIPFERRRVPRDVSTSIGLDTAHTGTKLDAGAALLLSLFEIVTICAVSLIAGTAYSYLMLGYAGNPTQFLSNGIFVAALFSCVMRARQSHDGIGLQATQSLRALFTVWLSIFGFVGFVWYFLKLDPSLSRGSFLGFFAMGFVAMAMLRAQAPEFIARVYHPRRHAGQNIMIVGAAGRLDQETIRREFRYTGCHNARSISLYIQGNDAEWQISLHNALLDIRTEARKSGHGQICVAAEGFTPAQLSALLNGLQAIPHAIKLVPDRSTEPLLHLPTRSLGRLRAFEIQRAPLNPLQRLLKRLLDLAITFPCLILVAPCMIGIAIAVKWDSQGPILFRQNRLGYRGKPFEIYKFRTMHVMENGDQVRQACLQDKRITRVGRYLRQSSLDELPQLFNVLKGEMSLVGPRPHAVAHDHFFASLIGNYELRQHVMPGVTGWAQIHGLRGETATTDAMRRRVEMDLWYAKNANLYLDLQILARTFIEVFRQRNAY